MSTLEKLSSIKRSSLHEELTDRLRTMIVEGVLVAGEKEPNVSYVKSLVYPAHPCAKH